jgi:effector-binding domain-containing protein/predicted hydrocarbon binding protein
MTVIYKEIDEILVASMRIHGRYADIPETLRKIQSICSMKIAGPPIVVHHWLVQDPFGHDMDVCVPISEPIESDIVKAGVLEKCEAMTIVHKGPYEKLGEAYREVTKETYDHGLPIAESGREVIINRNSENPEENIIEIQEVMHDWQHLFAENLESWVGTEDSQEIMECYDGITHESSLEERAEAIKCAMITLDRIATEEEKFEILSQCAHTFPPELIERMKNIYEDTHDIDIVLQKMEENGNYPKFTREGNVLYSSKQPYNPEAFAKATTREERMKAYCFCPMIKHSLDHISESFCYCGSGWVRRLWEGILEENVQVEIVKSLTKGDGECRFAVHLPI